MLGMTINQYIICGQRAHGGATGEFSALVSNIVTVCKTIASSVRYGRLAGTDVLGSTEEVNVQGETQKKLDIIANDLMLRGNEFSGHLAGIASEEMEHPFVIPEQYKRGKYLLITDPLDGSSNIPINGSIGTIFSILRRPDGASGDVTEQEFLQPGTRQVCAGYALYGPATMIVLTMGEGVQGFTLDQRVGEFILSHPNMTIPRQTSEFAINASYYRHWDQPIKRYIDECLAGKEGPLGKDFNMRWVAAMIADIHRLLQRGGIFMYPIDKKIRARGLGGKLRLMYEANPMSFIVEQAGGLASTGTERIMELQPEQLHQRCPVIMGAAEEVERVVRYHQEG